MSSTIRPTGQFTKEVCDLFDISLLSDMEPTDEMNCSSPWIEVYALGWRSELAAGIRAGTITEWFNTPEELEQFCQKHIARFRAASEDDGTIPDATDWGK
jgi:hypothetical protein